MPQDQLDLHAYLGRIGLAATGAPSLTLLRSVIARHTGSIPFENLDIVLGRPIRLDIGSVQAKLVGAGRGGYCFEQNTLFKAILDRIGFHSHIFTARVRFLGTRIGPRSHMLLKVETKSGAFLADVGFGAVGLLRPIPFMPDIVTHVPGAAFRLRHEQAVWVLEGDVGDDVFSDYYAFTLEPQYPVDIEVANHYTSTHPNSIFRRTVTAQLTKPHQRTTLRNQRLEILRGDDRHEVTLPDEAAIFASLRNEFGLDLPRDMRLALAAD